MGFIRKILDSEHRNFIIFAVVLPLGFLIYMTIGPGTNIINWIEVRREISRQEKQIEKYKTEIEEMDRRINMLSNDRDTLESFAREKFHFAAPGDDIYIIDE